MSESEEVVVHAPITISIDVDQLLKSELGWTTYNAGTYDDPEPEYAPGGNGRIVDLVAAKLAAAITRDVQAAVIETLKAVVLTKVDGLIDEVMSSPIQLTSTYGEPKAPETSMREAMIKAMSDRLDRPVNRDGKALDRGGLGTPFTYLQWRSEEVARNVMDKEMSSRLSEAAKQIKSAATELVSKRISEVLGRGF